MAGKAACKLWRFRQMLLHHRVNTGSGVAGGPTHSPTLSHRCRHFSTATARKGPPPVRVSLTESAGRGVFATRPIAAGEVVHTAKPLVAHPSPTAHHPVCYYCLRRLTSINNDFSTTSSSGRIYRFCSAGCLESSKGFLDFEKRANWSEFEDHCRSQKLKYPFLVKRMACMVASGSASAEALDILQPSFLSEDLLLQLEQEFQLLKSTLSDAIEEESTFGFLTKDWYVGVLARIRINAFRVELIGGQYEDLLADAAAFLGTDTSVGNAVYVFPSFYNHDCDPNMHMIWIDNGDAKLKTLREIEADEELRICYIDASMDRDARQELLFQGFGFRCNCSRCRDDY